MKHVLRSYGPSIRKYWLLLFVSLLAQTCALYGKTLSPYYARDIVNVFTSEVPEVALAYHLFWQLALVIVAINLSYRTFDYFFASFEAKVMRDLDQRSFAALQAQSINFFENNFSGSLVTIMTRFRNVSEGLTDAITLEISRDAILLVMTGIVFWQTMPSFALAFGLWTVIFLVLSVMAAIWKYPLDTANSEATSKVSGALADSITNHLTVKSFGRERAEQTRFNAVVEENYRQRIRAWLAGNLIIGGQGVMVGFAELMLIWWMIRGWEQGMVTAGDFVFFQAYVIMLLNYLWSFGRTVQKIFHYVADAKEMADIYQLVPQVRDGRNARSINIGRGMIKWHAVSFSYTDADATQFTLNNVNLHIPPGQSVGLVGKSGAGKSTFVRLLLRLSDPSLGYILIDHQDIADVTQESLRQQIAVVPQDPQLFHRTIRDNIAFGRQDASDHEIEDAARRAHAWEFIQALPQGLETIVGERGVKLSGGQRQRIAIARAILADPRILIFDEATSALDSETERHIRQAMANVLRGRTSLVIAHRLSTIMGLTRILVFAHGQIVEDGTHAELLALDGEYANLWRHQTGGYIA